MRQRVFASLNCQRLRRRGPSFSFGTKNVDLPSFRANGVSAGSYGFAKNLVALVANDHLEIGDSAAALDMEVAGDFD